MSEPSAPIMSLSIDLTGKRAFVAGVADDGGFGFAIAKALAEAGARVSVGTWPPALNIFEALLRRGKIEQSLALAGGGKLAFEHIVPLDAEYDTLSEAPEAIRENRRYKDRGTSRSPGPPRASRPSSARAATTLSSTRSRTAPR